jgi:hypothetical protein
MSQLYRRPVVIGRSAAWLAAVALVTLGACRYEMSSEPARQPEGEPTANRSAAALRPTSAPRSAAVFTPVRCQVDCPNVSGLSTSTGSPQSSAPTRPVLPAGWPATLELGINDGLGGAPAARSMAPFGFRYQYLAGGANTGSGWATWKPDGHFVTAYIEESREHDMIPVFTYYMLFQSTPGNRAANEGDGVVVNLRNTGTMAAYFADLRLFFQRAGASSSPVVLHVEPDLWGFTQQRADRDDAGTVAVQVAATMLPEFAGLPDTMQGFAQAVVRLRDQYAPNVTLGYHLSVWGTGDDIAYSDPPDSLVDGRAGRAADYYRSLEADFALVFTEFSDRDAGFKQVVYGDRGANWWDAADFRRHARFLSEFVGATQRPVVIWQIPFGNTKMRALNNTRGHYQDNRVEWLLDDPSRAHLTEYARAGVVALLFGRGAADTTCPCDAMGDGVTDFEPISGNTEFSFNADDDGGFFRRKAQEYYTTGALPVPPAMPVP